MSYLENKHQPDEQFQSLEDGIWFYFFDKNTLAIKSFMKRLSGQIDQEKNFSLIYYVQQVLSKQSESKKERVQKFLNQTQQIERNKIREGISYHYEAFITHILENIDFYLRNEIQMIELNLTIEKQHVEIKKDFEKIIKQFQDIFEIPNNNEIFMQKVEQEQQFLKCCQEYIAIEKLYCYDFWVFQSEKQRYYRYFCTCVRLFFFFYELAEYRSYKLKYYIDLYNEVYKEIDFQRQSFTIQELENIIKHYNNFFKLKHFKELEQSQQDLENLFSYCFNESKYCLFQISKNYQENDTNYLGLKLFTLLLNQLSEQFEKNRETIFKIKTEDMNISPEYFLQKIQNFKQNKQSFQQSEFQDLYNKLRIHNNQKRVLFNHFNCELQNVKKFLYEKLKVNESGLVEEFNNIINESKNKYDDIINNQSIEEIVQYYVFDQQTNKMVKVNQNQSKQSKAMMI